MPATAGGASVTRRLPAAAAPGTAVPASAAEAPEVPSGVELEAALLTDLSAAATVAKAALWRAVGGLVASVSRATRDLTHTHMRRVQIRAWHVSAQPAASVLKVLASTSLCADAPSRPQVTLQQRNVPGNAQRRFNVTAVLPDGALAAGGDGPVPALLGPPQVCRPRPPPRTPRPRPALPHAAPSPAPRYDPRPPTREMLCTLARPHTARSAGLCRRSRPTRSS